MNEKYSVPPKYIDNLEYIGTSLKNILSKGYGSIATENQTEITPQE